MNSPRSILRGAPRLVVVFALASCDPQVRVVEDSGGGKPPVSPISTGGQGPSAGGGGGGEGGSGGGSAGNGGATPVELRPITVRVERRLLTSTYTQFDASPLEGILVFSHAPNGSLVSTATTGPGGVAQMDVVDEGFVSAVSFVETHFDYANDEILSVRVLPGMESVRLPLEAAGYLGPAREPMKLRVEWPPLDEALYKVRASCFSSLVLPEEQSSLELSDFTGCPGSDAFAVVVEALLPGTQIYHPEVFGYVDNLSYVPGGELTVFVPLEPATEEATVFVEGAVSPGKVTDVKHAQLLPGTAVGYCPSCSDRELVEGGVQATTLTTAFPELRAWSEFYRYGECTFTELARVSTDVAPIEVAVSRLAGAVAWSDEQRPATEGSGMKTGGWRLLEGEVGDAILLSTSWSNGDRFLQWRMLDPIRLERRLESEGIPALELPSDVADVVGPQPTDSAFTLGLHLDVIEATDYATFLELLDSNQLHTQESGAWTCD